jgi:hypothetical protein
VTKDEKWHLSWIELKLYELAGADGAARVRDLLARYREVDRRVFAELEGKERAFYGLSLTGTAG